MSLTSSQINGVSIVCSTDCQAQIKEHIKALRQGNPPMTGGFLSQRASNEENVSIWLRHHDTI